MINKFTTPPAGRRQAAGGVVKRKQIYDSSPSHVTWSRVTTDLRHLPTNNSPYRPRSLEKCDIFVNYPKNLKKI